MINVYGMKSKSEMPEAHKDFIHNEGVPHILCWDNSQIQKGVHTTKLNQEFFMKDQFTEPNHPQQNPARLCTMKFLKDHSQVLIKQAHPNNVGSWIVNILQMYTMFVLTKL